MLKHTPAFSGYSVDDMDKARSFYGQTLGITIEDNTMGLLEMHFDNGHSVTLYPKPDHQPATFTVLNFPVENIDKAVDQLREKGVVFEQYGGAIATDEKGICRGDGNGPDIAWFKDPAGNILSVLVA